MVNTPTQKSSYVSLSSNEAANNIDQENNRRSAQKHDEEQHDGVEDDGQERNTTKNSKAPVSN